MLLGCAKFIEVKDEGQWEDLFVSLSNGTAKHLTRREMTEAGHGSAILSVTYRHGNQERGQPQITAQFKEKLADAAVNFAAETEVQYASLWLDRQLRISPRKEESSWAHVGLFPYLILENLMVDSGAGDYENRFWIAAEQPAARCGLGSRCYTRRVRGVWFDESRAGDQWTRSGDYKTMERSLLRLSAYVLEIAHLDYEVSWEEDKTEIIKFALNYLRTEGGGCAILSVSDVVCESQLEELELARVLVKSSIGSSVDAEIRKGLNWKGKRLSTAGQVGKCWNGWYGCAEWFPATVHRSITEAQTKRLAHQLSYFTSWDYYTSEQGRRFAIGVFSFNYLNHHMIAVELSSRTESDAEHVEWSQRFRISAPGIRFGDTRNVINSVTDLLE